MLLLLGARHAPLGAQFTERAARVVLAAGAVVAAVGVFEAIDSSSWNHFVVHTIKYPGYHVAVLNDHPLHPNDIRTYGTIGGTQVVRIGSVFLNDLSCGWYLAFPSLWAWSEPSGEVRRPRCCWRRYWLALLCY